MPDFSSLGQAIFDLLNTYGHHALFAILFAEEAGFPLPIPGDVFLLYVGLNLSGSPLLSILTASLWSSIGIVLGSTILYSLAKWGGTPLFAKYGKYILITPNRLEKMEKWFTKHSRYAVFLGRFVPGLRILVSAFAGLAGLPLKIFLPQVIAASFCWSLLFLSLGHFFGSKSLLVVHTINQYSILFLLGFILTLTFNILKSHLSLSPKYRRG